MKYFVCAVVLILGIIAVQSQEEIKQFKEIVEKCGTELKLDVKFITEAKEKPNLEKLKTPEYKCFSKCLMEKYGAVDAQGNFVMAKVKEAMPKMTAEAEKVIQGCADKHKEADLCERYKNMHTCMYAVKA